MKIHFKIRKLRANWHIAASYPILRGFLLYSDIALPLPLPPPPCLGSVLKYSDGKQIFNQKFNNKAEPFSKNKWTTIGIGQKGCEAAGRGGAEMSKRNISLSRSHSYIFFTSCVVWPSRKCPKQLDRPT